MSSSATLNVLVTAQTASLTSGMSAASNAVKGLGAAVASAAAPLLALVGLGAGLAGVFSQFKEIEDIGKAAKMFGDTTENMSALAYAAGKTGISLEELTGHAHHMSKEVGDALQGNSEAIQKFNKLNIDFTKFGTLSFTQQLEVAADKVKAMKSPSEQMALSMQLFGKSGNELLPFLTKGSAGIEELMQKGKQSGQVFGQQAVDDYKNFTKAVGNMKDIVTGVFRQIAIAMTPTLSAIGDFVNGSIKYAQDLYTQFTPEINQLKDVVIDVFTAMKDMALNVWERVVSGGKMVLEFFGVDMGKSLTDMRAQFLITFSTVEVYAQNWWLVMQRIWVGAELSVVTFANNFSRGIEKIIGIIGVLSNVMQRGIEGTMDDIKTIMESSRPFSPLEEQLMATAAQMDKELGSKLEETIRKRLEAFNQKAKIEVNNANKIPDVSGNQAVKQEAAGAVQQGSVEAMSAIFKDRSNVSAQQLNEQKKANGLLQQIVNQANNGGQFLKPLGL